MSIFLTSPVTFHLLMYGLLFNNIFKLYEIKGEKSLEKRDLKFKCLFTPAQLTFFLLK